MMAPSGERTAAGPNVVTEKDVPAASSMLRRGGVEHAKRIAAKAVAVPSFTKGFFITGFASADGRTEADMVLRCRRETCKTWPLPHRP
jgi:hypothetical protein